MRSVVQTIPNVSRITNNFLSDLSGSRRIARTIIMTIDLYYSDVSTQCTAIRMVATALGVPLNLKLVNLFTGEHLAADFVELNPQHTVPTLVDDGFVIWESRAILTYLVEQYGQPAASNDHPLLPSGARRRATINQRLYFDIGTLHRHYYDAVLPQIFLKRPPPSDVMNKAQDAVELLNTLLAAENNGWLAGGESATVADYAVATTMMGVQLLDVDLTYAGSVKRWLANCKQHLVGWELVEANVERLKSVLQSKV